MKCFIYHYQKDIYDKGKKQNQKNDDWIIWRTVFF